MLSRVESDFAHSGELPHPRDRARQGSGASGEPQGDVGAKEELRSRDLGNAGQAREDGGLSAGGRLEERKSAVHPAPERCAREASLSVRFDHFRRFSIQQHYGAQRHPDGRDAPVPRGITDQFLKILDLESRRAWAVLAAGAVAFAVALFLADLADRPRFGDVTVAFAAVALLATAVTALWAWRRAKWRTMRLADEWSAWMKFSVGSASIAEIERKVRDRPASPPWAPGLVVALFAIANAVVFALLWADAAIAVAAALAIAVANGLAIGVLLGTTGLRLWWARSATAAANDLVGSGAVSVWGER